MGLNEKLKFFANLGENYCRVYLSKYNWGRIENDATYGLKAFLYGWAYERAGAPRSWKIAAVKAIEESSKPGMASLFTGMASLFNKYCPPREGKNNNEARNPCMHDQIRSINIPDVCKFIQKGNFESAFRHMKGTSTQEGIPGLRSHKLRAFFLRDLTVNIAEKEPDKPEDLLFLQPVDIWVMKTADFLGLGDSREEMPGGYGTKYDINKAQYHRANSLINESLKVNVSPLKVNQGIWYFCANFVASEERLRTLLQSPEGAKALKDEMGLLEEFNPKSLSPDNA